MRQAQIVGAALASASVLALSTGASAQAQVYNWTGFYIGGNLGYAWGHSDTSSSVDCTPPVGMAGYICNSTFALGLANGAAVSASGSGRANANSVIGGFQVGGNWQFQNIVVGFEADANAMSLHASRTASARYVGFGGGPNATNTYTITSTVDADRLFTARGRVGMAFASLMIYGTGGLAATTLRVTNGFTDDFNIPSNARESASQSKGKFGWTAGGGGEWALNNHWSVKGEYLFVSFGSVSAAGLIVTPLGFTGYANGLATAANLRAHIARFGVNYRF
jgi:outer membrane immunogenic protein